MIKIELYDKSIKGKKIIENLVPWQESELGHETMKNEKEIIDIFKYDRLDEKNIKITCDQNHYIKIPNFCKTYYTFSMDDNFMDDELLIISNELNEVYILLSENEIDFKKRGTKFRPYIIDEISTDGNIINRYLINIFIKYKDNGKIANDEFKFQYEIRISKVFTINITYGLPEYIFLGYIIWFICNLIARNNIIKLINNPTVIIVFISCFIFSVVKAIFVETSLINQLLYLLKIKRRFYYTNRELKKMIKEYKKQNDVV